MRKLLKNKLGYTAVIGTLVAVLIMIIVGVLVYWETSDAIELDSADANDSKNETDDMAANVFELAPIIPLVLVAAIIIGIIVGFGTGRLPGM